MYTPSFDLSFALQRFHFSKKRQAFKVNPWCNCWLIEM